MEPNTSNVFVKNVDDWCQPRVLDTDEAGYVPSCFFVEVLLGELDCNVAGRTEVSELVADGVRNEMANNDVCGSDIGFPCPDAHMCAITQLEGPEHDACISDPTYSGAAGFCYIDATVGGVSTCDASSASELRFPAAEPRPDTLLYTACIDS